ncbi:MAG TPA: 3-hydroxyacyl-CoA dehydrogenase family protein [Bacillota bacterium]
MDPKAEQNILDRSQLIAFAEACRLLDEGISSMKDIDLAMRAGAGYAAGPFAMADQMGLDVVLQKMEGLQKQYGENRFYISSRLRDLVARGHLGVKTQKGFYEYTGGAPQ